VSLLKIFIQKIKTIFDFYVFFMILGVGLFSYFFETNNLKQKKLKKEEKFARIIGIVYFILPFVLLLVARFM